MCKEVYGYVYMVKNLVNGKLYFGITINNFNTRYDGNIAKHTHNEHLKHSIEKYGIENFEINEEFDIAYTEDDLWDLEDLYICIYNTLDGRYGYNKRRSGSKHKGSGKTSEESRYKNSESHKALYENGYVNPMQGRKHTEESKRKIGEKSKGRNVGLKRSEETRHKISEARKGYKHTQEARKNMSKAQQDINKRGLNGNAKPVICLNTLQIFDCMANGGEWCGLKASQKIGECCRKSRKSAGKHPITKERLHWMFYDEYLKLQENSDTNAEDVA